MTQQLVALTGSDKQVAWAEDIRREALETLATFRASAEKTIASPLVLKLQLRSIDGAAEWLSTQTDAGWFINAIRGKSGGDLVQMFLKK